MKLNELRAELARNGMTIEALSEETGIARTTLWRRFNNSGEFTLEEIKKISAKLNITSERIVEIFFANEVA